LRRGQFTLIEVMLPREAISKTLARFVSGFKAVRARASASAWRDEEKDRYQRCELQIKDPRADAGVRMLLSIMPKRQSPTETAIVSRPHIASGAFPAGQGGRETRDRQGDGMS
jgi:hypothetical protein